MDLPSYHVCSKRAPRLVAFTRHNLRAELIDSDDIPVTHFMSTYYIHPEVLDKMKKAAENQKPESTSGSGEEKGQVVECKIEEQATRHVSSPLGNITNTIGVRKDGATNKSLWDKIEYPVYQDCTKDENVERALADIKRKFMQVYDEDGMSHDANAKAIPLNRLGTTTQLRMILKSFRHDVSTVFSTLHSFALFWLQLCFEESTLLISHFLSVWLEIIRLPNYHLFLKHLAVVNAMSLQIIANTT